MDQLLRCRALVFQFLRLPMPDCDEHSSANKNRALGSDVCGRKWALDNSGGTKSNHLYVLKASSAVVARQRRRVDTYRYSSTVFGPRREREKISLVTMVALYYQALLHSLQDELY
jgi:hypothetical protein